MDHSELQRYQQVQNLARTTLLYLCSHIKAGMSEADIVALGDCYMQEQGATSFWYHGLGTFVLAGERSRLSLSGKDYLPSHAAIPDGSLLAIDLSPAINGYWGDFARSVAIGHGTVTYEPAHIRSSELVEGFLAEQALHEHFVQIAYASMTFHDLHAQMTSFLHSTGFVNLDFKGNFGHTIEHVLDKRRYLEEGNALALADAGLFTFEPHLGKKEGNFGYKLEDIYYWHEGLKKL